jgi:biotin carboxylase
VSLVEQGMRPVGRINDLLGLPGTSFEVSNCFLDKLSMRAHLVETGFEDVVAELVTSPEQLRAFGACHRYPFILKPLDGTGSRGVTKIENADQIDQAWKESTALRGRNDLKMSTFYPVNRFMAEAYVDGPEFSVESFSFAGRHSIIAITEKVTSGMVEVAHAQPARLSETDDAAIRRHVSRFLDVMGLRDGVGCTEVKLSPDGPRIIESHDRVAGDRLMDLVHAVYGIDLETYAVGWPYGLVSALPGQPRANGAAATRFLSARPGVVRRIDGAERVRSSSDVLDLDIAVAVGEEVPSVHDNFDRVGQVIVAAQDTGTAVARCAELAAQVQFVVESP